MRSRNRLHKTKLAEFTAWLEAQGWRTAPTKGTYEVLRMTRPGEPPLLVYEKMRAKEHYTTHGVADVMLTQWLRQRR